MNPIKNFHKNTQVLRGTSSNVDPLHVLCMIHKTDGQEYPVIVSCWRVTWKDILRVIFTRTVWMVTKGNVQPPVFLETDKAFTGIDEFTAFENGNVA